MQSILIMFHCESNTGYAIGRLEPIFFKVALALANNDISRIHVSYTAMNRGKPTTLPDDFSQIVAIDPTNASQESCNRVSEYIRTHHIDTIFGFDQPVHRPIYKYFRAAGVKHFVSYMGAPMSSIFGPFKRLLKRLDVMRRTHRPDLFIFESQGMADTAVLGRGISAKDVRVVYLSVDTQRFYPEPSDAAYVYSAFGIPSHRRIFFYSGHMEPRKGVGTIIGAANLLAKKRKQDDWHILILGNKDHEADYLEAQLESEDARSHVTFGGYRDDVETLHRGCYAGIIASTGWDSLTCSSIEMQASGLPVILSSLPGLREAIEHNVSGLHFEPGNMSALVATIEDLLEDEKLRARLSLGATQRAQLSFSLDTQIECLVSAVRSLTG